MRRLASTLAVLEQRDGKLNPSSLAAISAAQKLGGSALTALEEGPRRARFQAVLSWGHSDVWPQRDIEERAEGEGVGAARAKAR